MGLQDVLFTAVGGALMGYKGMPEEGDWDRLYELEQQVNQNGGLDPDASCRELLVRVAPTVGFTREEAATAIATVEGAGRFVLEARSRIREGSHRLTKAIIRRAELCEQGRPDEARPLFEAIIRDDPIPFYRELAENELWKLDHPKRE
jgi:DUSAM domain-containing protein